MSHRGGRQRYRNQDRDKDHQKSQQVEPIDSSNPVIKNFQNYSIELNDKHDRHERLVKLSRDLTIESKRIIFLLHNIDARKGNKETVLKEAQERIEKLFQQNFKTVATELNGLDVYQYMRAISAGIQEFIEALTFYEYLSNENAKLSDWNDIQNRMCYENEEATGKSIKLHLEPCEYILGLADLTGEVMRNCINSLGSSDTEKCYETCKFLQSIYSKFLTIRAPANRGRDFSQKMSTMRASTMKCENVCYNLKVRGTEGSNMMSFEAVQVDDHVDEGFF